MICITLCIYDHICITCLYDYAYNHICITLCIYDYMICRLYDPHQGSWTKRSHRLEVRLMRFDCIIYYNNYNVLYNIHDTNLHQGSWTKRSQRLEVRLMQSSTVKMAVKDLSSVSSSLYNNTNNENDNDDNDNNNNNNK